MILLLAIILLPAAILLAGVLIIHTLAAIARRARRHRRELQSLTEQEALAAVAPFTEPIAVWPSRAPRNGSAYDHIE
jgi:hypothetical protein